MAIAGLTWIFGPVILVVAGIGIAVTALLVDVEKKGRRRR
jgi:hypothetical protein